MDENLKPKHSNWNEYKYNTNTLQNNEGITNLTILQVAIIFHLKQYYFREETELKYIINSFWLPGFWRNCRLHCKGKVLFEHW
jgi:hypothetical protein